MIYQNTRKALSKSISENFSRRERYLDKQPSRFEVFQVLNEGERE